MGLYDTIQSDYPLPDPQHQDLEFQTKSLDSAMERYTITAEGRLLKHPGGGLFDEPPEDPLEPDVEVPIHGDIEIHQSWTRDGEREWAEYKVRFTHDRVEWIRPLERPRRRPEQPRTAPAPSSQVKEGPPTPGLMGRRLRAAEFSACTPEKLELLDGQMPGDKAMLLLLLTSFGLRRTAALVGHDLWREALPDASIRKDEELGGPDERESPSSRHQEIILLANLKKRRKWVEEILVACSSHWGYEDPVYRFYHQSFKVCALQSKTEEIVRELTSLVQDRPLNRWFQGIVARGTGLAFSMEDNANWSDATRPILEAFFHARFFLEMAVRYADLESPPQTLPSGYAALLYLFDLR